jgi:putative colanic acid biosynthesis acetyltransferase WcaF
MNLNTKIDLSTFSTSPYKKGNRVTVILWFVTNYVIFNSSIPWPQPLKRQLLRLFGARVGKGLVIKIRVRIKYPWRLTIGDHCWLGEDVWIDNLEQVTIGSHVCLSQGSMLLTGNHDYTRTDFPYRLGRIVLEDGVWIGARAVVCADVVCYTHAILTVNSVATRPMTPWQIYTGNPAVAVRQRKIQA